MLYWIPLCAVYWGNVSCLKIELLVSATLSALGNPLFQLQVPKAYRSIAGAMQLMWYWLNKCWSCNWRASVSLLIHLQIPNKRVCFSHLVLQQWGWTLAIGTSECTWDGRCPGFSLIHPSFSYDKSLDACICLSLFLLLCPSKIAS